MGVDNLAAQRPIARFERLRMASAGFCGIMSKFPTDHVRTYAREYVKRLCKVPEEDLTDVGEKDGPTLQIVTRAFPTFWGGRSSYRNSELSRGSRRRSSGGALSQSLRGRVFSKIMVMVHVHSSSKKVDHLDPEHVSDDILPVHCQQVIRNSQNS